MRKAVTYETVLSALDGDSEARNDLLRDAFVESFCKWLFRNGRLKSPDKDWADLFQLTRVRIDKMLARTTKPQFDSIEAYHAYVRAIATSICNTIYRKYKKSCDDNVERIDDRNSAALNKLFCPGLSPEDRVMLVEIGQILMTIKPERAEAFLLRYVDGLTIGEIMERLDKSRATIQRYLAEALKALDGMSPTHL